jgi:uncharacterized protein (TIGR03089 family)
VDSVAEVLDRAERGGGHRPFVTFADGETGERTELGVAAAANWARKTANLLIEEFGAGPGALVGVRPFNHWTAPLIALGAWVTAAGLTTSEQALAWFAAEEDAPDVPGRPLVLIGRAMAGRCAADPAAVGAAFGYAETVLGFGDHVDPDSIDEHAWALVAQGTRLTHGELLASPPSADRILLAHPPFGPAWCTAVLGALTGGGSLVLAHRMDDERVARLCEQERVTRRAS